MIRICTALDGIPLAIELAAARLRGLTAEQVADRLDDRFRLLSVGSRGTLPRHQTLRAIVDWSWDLLDDPERAVLRRLSVFSGGATPDSAEQVCAGAGPDPGPDPAEIIDIIAALVDKSLVTATGEAQVRYRLLETVRAYAADRLAEAGEADRVRTAHAEFFLSLAERGEPRLRGPRAAALAGPADRRARQLRRRAAVRPGQRGRPDGAAVRRGAGLVLAHPGLRERGGRVGGRGRAGRRHPAGRAGGLLRAVRAVRDDPRVPAGQPGPGAAARGPWAAGGRPLPRPAATR